jgi:hypothetical protein
MSRLVLSMLLWMVALAVPVTAAEPVYANYRGAFLGDPVSVVVSHFKMTLAEVATVHERPTLVQRITWRPHRFIADTISTPAALDEMEFTFHRGRLVRMVVTYDSERTEGLTNADLREAFTHTYGAPALVASNPMAAVEIGRPLRPADVVGEWGDGSTLVVLSRVLYPRRVVLTITSIADDRAMQSAVTAGVRLDQQEALSQDLIQRVLDATTVQDRSEKARRRNKAAFAP